MPPESAGGLCACSHEGVSNSASGGASLTLFSSREAAFRVAERLGVGQVSAASPVHQSLPAFEVELEGLC